ncbi:MAG: hypothetical protein MJ079_01050 [Ruminococcus sp.]|nr:hypothetical protein [Ruminococcus sp.]
MKCISCGFEHEADAVFCSQCGRKIEFPTEKAAEVTAAVSGAASAIKEDAAISAEKAKNTVENIGESISEKLSEDTADAVSAEPQDTVAKIDKALEVLNSAAVTAAADEKPAVSKAAEEVREAAPAPEIKPLKKIEKQEAPAITAAPSAVQNVISENIPQQADAPQYAQQQYAPYSDIYAPQQPEAVEEAEEATVKVGALRISFAGFIAVLTIIFLTLVTLLFCLRTGASGNLLKKRTEKMNISTVLDANLGKRSLSDAIFNETDFAEASQDEISKAEFRGYLSKTNLLSYAGGFVKEYADYLIKGEISDPSVDANDMADFFVQNSDVADEELSYKLKTSDYNRIRTSLELKDTADNFSIEKWSEKAHFDLANLSFVFSFVTLGILLGLVIVLLVWIAVIVDGKGRHIVSMYGSIFSCSGGIVFLIGFAAVAGTAIAHIITGNFVFYLCASLLLPFGLFALGIGAVEYVIGFIFKRIRRGIKNSDKRNKAVEKALMGV